MATYALMLVVLLAVFPDASLLLPMLAFPASAVAQTRVPQFKSIDEMVGWVKAKGDCKKMGIGKRCDIRINLPNEETVEDKGKGVWEAWAWIELTEFDQRPERFFYVTIIKSRYFALLPTDSRSIIRSVKRSQYFFTQDGKVSEASIGVVLETSTGEHLLEQDIPLGPKFIHNHGEGGTDSIILRSHLGIGWEYMQR